MKVIKSKLNKLHSYTVFDVNNIEVGDAAPFDIYIKRDKDYLIIIEAGTILSESLYKKLQKQDQLYILKKDENKQVLTCETLRYYLRHNSDAEKRLKLVYEATNPIFDEYLKNDDNKIDIDCAKLIVKSIIYLIQSDEGFIKKTLPFFLNDDKIATHSIHVTIYAVKLGSLINLNNDQLLQIGLAAILHDLGYKKIDASITTNSSRLTQQQIKEVQKHSQYSVEIVKKNQIHDPYIINAIMHHHERYDGSGYPEGLEVEDISDFASILAICDVFDALTNNRPHREKYTSFDALKMMMKESSMINKFNQKYLILALKSLS